MTFDVVDGLMYDDAGDPRLERPFALIVKVVQRGEYLEKRVLYNVAGILLISNIQ